VTALIYAYCIANAASAVAVDAAALEGIDGGRVRAVTDGALAAAVSDVDQREYDSTPLNERVRELEWLTPRAAAHQAVNGRLLELLGAVLPRSFGSIHGNEERMRAVLRDDAPALASRLHELAGRAEWVLTLTRDAAAQPDDEDVRALDQEIAGSAPGRAFLLEKRRTTVASRSIERRDAAAADEALRAVGDVAERSYREPVAQSGTDVIVLRASLLVPRARESDLADAVVRAEGQLGALGYRMRASGPWPAYRFGGMP